jgi:hypothetical protein
MHAADGSVHRSNVFRNGRFPETMANGIASPPQIATGVVTGTYIERRKHES